MQSYRPAWVEVNLDSIAHNVENQERVGQAVRIMATVKGDRYWPRRLRGSFHRSANGAEIAVAMVDEGIELRRSRHQSSILILACQCRNTPRKLSITI